MLFSCQTTLPISNTYTDSTANVNEREVSDSSTSSPNNTQAGSYTMVVEGYDWGPAVSKVIIPLGTTISFIQKENYSVTIKKETVYKELTTEEATGERTILYAYVSDEKGEKIEKGKHATLVLLVAPNLPISSPMMYIPSFNGNVWVDYEMTITNNYANQVWNIESNRIHPLVDDFDITGKFKYNKEVSLTYADYTPTTSQEKIPLIIWLHGGGEGGIDPSIALLANRAANYASPEIQAFFGGAYVLVPQTPTFWMDNGQGEYTLGDVNDRYNEGLMALIKDYVAKHPKIDENRIYVGGCSNGGYMSLKLMLLHPDYFAASFPSALAYHAQYISDEQIESIKEMPIWFIHSKDDSVTKPENTVLPIYNRLMEAGAENVHFSYYDHVVDITGFFGGDNYHYLGHFSWIYCHANLCTLDYDKQPVTFNGRAVTIMEWMAAQKRK